MLIKQIKVFVVDAEEKPLLPTTATRARILLKKGKGKVIGYVIKIQSVCEEECYG